ncbi:hypothetical protein [Novosphingobium marinum]|uniref:hypothetical protein n=1 Tax=Novosphingobium marinum TaxID=1514948 RepID=UPI0015C88329|nr:hypothetical protein [Novosphingobium marinum]
MPLPSQWIEYAGGNWGFCCAATLTRIKLPSRAIEICSHFRILREIKESATVTLEGSVRRRNNPGPRGADTAAMDEAKCAN